MRGNSAAEAFTLGSWILHRLALTRGVKGIDDPRLRLKKKSPYMYRPWNRLGDKVLAAARDSRQQMGMKKKP